MQLTHDLDELQLLQAPSTKTGIKPYIKIIQQKLTALSSLLQQVTVLTDLKA